MEGTLSKGDIIKPIVLKAGVPLAVSIAGLVYAWIMAKKSISKASYSLPEATNSSNQSEVSFHSDASIEGVYANNVVPDGSIIDDTRCLEQEIACLRSRFEGMKIRELALRFQFDQYRSLKEQECMLGDLNNMLAIETARVEFLDKEISSMERENKRLENFLVQYIKLVEQIEYWKSENRMLQRKFQRLLRKSKAQSRLAKEQALKIRAEEAEMLRRQDALQIKNEDIDKLEDEIRGLKRVSDQLQDENNELLNKLDIAENTYASKIETGNIISKEDYEKVLNELEQIKKESADEVKELVFLRWTNACLKHELTMNHEQHRNQDREHIELEFGGSDGVIHYDSEHELHNDSPLEHHIVVHSFDDAHHHHHRNSSACSKRRKLLRRIKRWVEGSDKEKDRHSVS